MKRLLKDCKKGGLSGMKARRRMYFALGATAFAVILCIMCFMTGGFAGIGTGLVFASVPVAFTMPEGVELTDTEKKGLEALADHLNKQVGEFMKDAIDEKTMVAKMNELLQDWGEKNRVDKDKIEALEKTLKEQGARIAAFKESPMNPKAQMTGLKAEFFKGYDALKAAVKNRVINHIVKANPDISDNTLLESRAVITTTTGAVLQEQIGQDPELYLKRRDRQYIHDIADVSHVANVPETYSFDEEGDESGAIAIVGENGLKPQVQLKLIKNKVDAQKAAGYIVVTEELMKWRTRAWAQIRRLFQDKVYRDYENLLTTSLLTYATQYIGTSLDGTFPADQVTDFSAIIAGILQLETLNFEPDTLVLNPADKWKLAMTTTPNGVFVLPYIQNGGKFSLLALNVITTSKVAAGTFLLGESGIWKVEEEPPQLRTGLVNDDFIHNRMTIVGEIFFLSYVPSNNAGGWLEGNFADIKEALAVVEVNE
jgi:hypothetical protein